MKKMTAAILIGGVILGLLLLISAAGKLSGESLEAEGRGVAAENEGKSEESEKQDVKKIALTFDDGPHPHYTGQLLDGLKERGVRATFFVTGEHAGLHPDIIERMQQDA